MHHGINCLQDFQNAVFETVNEYEQYLIEDMNECEEDGESDYVEQRQRQIEEIQRLRGHLGSVIYSLTKFNE